MCRCLTIVIECGNAYSMNCTSMYFCATVCNMVRPVLPDRCLSVLSVTLVHCGQTVGWIKMKLGTQAVA